MCRLTGRGRLKGGKPGKKTSPAVLDPRKHAFEGRSSIVDGGGLKIEWREAFGIVSRRAVKAGAGLRRSGAVGMGRSILFFFFSPPPERRGVGPLCTMEKGRRQTGKDEKRGGGKMPGITAQGTFAKILASTRGDIEK